MCRSWWRRVVLFRVARFRRVLARPLPDGAAPQSRALLGNAGTRIATSFSSQRQQGPIPDLTGVDVVRGRSAIAASFTVIPS